MIQGMIFRQQSAQFDNQNRVMNEFLTDPAAAVGYTNTVGSRQADAEERKLARDLAQNIPKFDGDGIGTWKWKVKKCAGTRFENLG